MNFVELVVLGAAIFDHLWIIVYTARVSWESLRIVDPNVSFSDYWTQLQNSNVWFVCVKNHEKNAVRSSILERRTVTFTLLQLPTKTRLTTTLYCHFYH